MTNAQISSIKDNVDELKKSNKKITCICRKLKKYSKELTEKISKIK